jgi:hypothetical protein
LFRKRASRAENHAPTIEIGAFAIVRETLVFPERRFVFESSLSGAQSVIRETK